MDWDKIKTEYITTNISYRELAEKYGVSFSSMTKMASKQKWNEKRKQNRKKIETKTLEKISTMEADRQARMADTLYSGIDKILKIWNKKISKMEDADTKELRSMVQTAVDIKGFLADKDGEDDFKEFAESILDRFVDGKH